MFSSAAYLPLASTLTGPYDPSLAYRPLVSTLRLAASAKRHERGTPRQHHAQVRGQTHRAQGGVQHAQHTLGCTHGPTDPCPLALQVEEDLRARLLHLRTDVSATGVLNELHLTDKTAKKLVERFPEDAHLKSQELETFGRASPALLQAWEPSYTLLVQLAEFRQESLKLLSEMSRELAKLSMDLNPAVLREYFNFTLAYAKLHLLLGACLQDQGRLVLCPV